MRSLGIVLLLGLVGGLGMLGLMGASWIVLLPGLLAGAALHWMIWSEDIRQEWQRGRRWPGLKLWARDLVGLAAAFAVGRLLAGLAAG